MKKAVFIIPYFGKLGSNLNIWMKSASFNPEFDFWIFTDDKLPECRYENIKFISIQFDQFIEKTQRKFEFKIGLTAARKLCDFRPAYGYVFEEEITEYPYWGYCDIDLILGDLNLMIPVEAFEYDKIFTHGHMTLMRNTPENNRRFMLPVEGYSSYIKILSDEKNLIFDESSNDLNLNLIFQRNKIPCYVDYAIADINPYKYLFYKSNYDYSLAVKSERNITYDYEVRRVFLWDNGKLFDYKLSAGNSVERNEIRYVHFQKRPMTYEFQNCSANRYLMVPNRILPFEQEITPEIIRNFTRNKLFYDQFLKLKWKNLKKRFLRG